jgi:site-specific DNA-methyltransferase (adenine-specific)
MSYDAADNSAKCYDCVDVLRLLPESSIDSVVCDPPYGLEFMGKAWDTFTGAGMSKPGIGERRIEWPSFVGSNTKRCRECSLLIGHGGSPCKCPTPKPYNAALPRLQGFGKWCELWAIEVLRVLRPGGHLVAFSGTRTYHRMACAIEDAGFEIRDQIGWAYGSGFPKSRNIGDGWGTALKPAWEPICLARKPLIGTVATNVLEHGTGAINIDGCRVHADDAQGGEYTVKRLKPGATLNATGGNWRPEEGGVEYHGEMKPGRWPANLIHDGSEDALAAFPESAGQQGDLVGHSHGRKSQGIYGDLPAARDALARNDSGSAARFFYTAKADAEDRLGSKHPTVKPLDLMQWLVRLVTPKGGMVLDPFAGTGTTGEAAWREGMRATLIEREPEYQADIARRMDLATKPTKRTAVAKTKNQLDQPEDLPLFREPAE